MVSSFARTDEPRNKRNALLIEEHGRIDVFALRRSGCLVEGWSGMVDTGPGGSQPALRKAGFLEIGGQAILVRPHPALPVYVFGCPKCLRDAYVLHLVAGEWRCRTCPPALDYASRRRNRTVPGWARAAELRRRLHADSTPFSALPKLSSPRRIRLAMELRRLEQGLAAHGAEVARVLERRHARRYGREGS